MFTTWADLYRTMLDDLASGQWRRVRSYQIGDRQITYRSFDEFLKQLEFVKAQADQEAGLGGGGRICAVPLRSGRH
jgi:formylglycine-generating enzyme required for sulfatase activity